MLLVLPLMLIPFITLAFWALGGGKGTADKNQSNTNAGLNLQLPNANLKDDKNEDKLFFLRGGRCRFIKTGRSVAKRPIL
jgi:hypothetical protein